MAQPAVSAEIEALTQVLALVEAFKAFNSDNDGQITTAELGGILASLGYNVSEQDVRAMMKQGDKNKDGLLSTEEFLELNTKEMELSGLASSLKAAFDALNCNGDEVFTDEELFEAIESEGLGLSLEVCQELIASMDSDGDGAVSCEDLGLIIRLIINAIISCEDLGTSTAHINLVALRVGTLFSGFDSIFGCGFLMMALVALVQIKLGTLACGDLYILATVTPLILFWCSRAL